MEHSYRFYQNRECEYFPCHKVRNEEEFNCLFCFCPLYALGSGCGGNCSYTKEGIKDCSACLFPHIPENYEAILHKMAEVLEMAKRPEENRQMP